MERQMDKKWTKGDQKDNLSFTALVRLKKNLSLTIMINKFNYHAVVHLFSSRLLVNTHKVRKS